MTQSPSQMPLMMSGQTPGSGPAGTKLTPVDPIRLLRQYQWLLIGSAVVGVILGLMTYFLLYKFNPQYTSSAQISVSSPLTDPMAVTPGTAPGGDTTELYKLTQAMIINSPDNLHKVLLRPDVRNSEWFKSRFADAQGNINTEEAYKALDKAVRVQPIAKTQLITISVTTSSAADSELLANAVVDGYIDFVISNSKTDRTVIEQLFSNRRNGIQENIASLRQRAAAIMDESQLTAAQTNFNEVDAVYQNLIGQQQNTGQQLNMAQQLLASVEQSAKSGSSDFSPDELATVDNDPAVRNVDARIMGLREERRVAMEHFGPDHRAVKDIDYRIAAAQSEKDQKRQELLAQLQGVKLSQAQNQVAALQGALATIEKQLVDVRDRRRELNRQLTSYNALKDDIRRQEDQLMGMDTSLNSLSIMRERPDSVRVTRQGRANRPQEVSFPKAKVVVPAVTFLVVALVAGLVFLKEMLDSRIKSPSDVKLLPKADLLGVIPHAEEDPNGKNEIDLVVAHQPTGLLAENFRQLRTEVMNRMQRRRFRTLMVAGCEPSGGVTAVTINLACSLALNDRKVLVIDANFRRPSLHTRFQLGQGPGLGDLLRGSAQIDAVVRATPVNNLDAITIGDAGDRILEALESDAFTQLLRKLEDRYELILIDAPPMSIVGDSRLLANRMDAVMLVVRAMQEKRGLVSRVMNQLANSRAEFMGLVLNGVRSSAGGYFRRNYQQFYEYQSSGSAPARPARRGAAARS
ncbi:MAG: GumC family protein [Phycisphaerales bacterium]